MECREPFCWTIPSPRTIPQSSLLCHLWLRYWHRLRKCEGKKNRRNKENSAWADTKETNAHPVLSVSRTGVLFQQGEMGILWTHFSPEKHTSNSLNRATVILMAIQGFRKKAAGFHHMFSELLFKEIRSMLVKCLVMRLSALLFCWTVSLWPCTSFILAVFRLTKNYHMQTALVYGISLQRSRADWGHTSSVCPGRAMSPPGWQPPK